MQKWANKQQLCNKQLNVIKRLSRFRIFKVFIKHKTTAADTQLANDPQQFI